MGYASFLFRVRNQKRSVPRFQTTSSPFHDSHHCLFVVLSAVSNLWGLNVQLWIFTPTSLYKSATRPFISMKNLTSRGSVRPEISQWSTSDGVLTHRLPRRLLQKTLVCVPNVFPRHIDSHYRLCSFSRHEYWFLCQLLPIINQGSFVLLLLFLVYFNHPHFILPILLPSCSLHKIRAVLCCSHALVSQSSRRAHYRRCTTQYLPFTAPPGPCC